MADECLAVSSEANGWRWAMLSAPRFVCIQAGFDAQFSPKWVSRSWRTFRAARNRTTLTPEESSVSKAMIAGRSPDLSTEFVRRMERSGSTRLT